MKTIHDVLRSTVARSPSLGREGVREAFRRSSASCSPQTPARAEAIPAGGLVYLVAPLDTIRDRAGFGDDVAVLPCVAARLNPEFRRLVDVRARKWFGD